MNQLDEILKTFFKGVIIVIPKLIKMINEALSEKIEIDYIIMGSDIYNMLETEIKLISKKMGIKNFIFQNERVYTFRDILIIRSLNKNNTIELFSKRLDKKKLNKEIKKFRKKLESFEEGLGGDI